jgi:transcriptional regulator with XRE-family HTH domain
VPSGMPNEKRNFLKRNKKVYIKNFSLFVNNLFVNKKKFTLILFKFIQMKKLRNQLGLTQTDMAMLMGSSKAKSSLYEKGLRSLNTNELSILSALELVVNDASAMQATEIIDSNDQKALLATLKKLAYNQKEVALKVARMQEKLLKMKTDYPAILSCCRYLTS